MVNTKQKHPVAEIYISRRELSNRLDVSQRTVQRLEEAKVISRVQIGGSVKYNWQEVYTKIQSQSKNAY
jgi:DeoR/GlpR family transcriptional regulator of sugar metabolism